MGGLTGADAVYAMIARGELFVDLAKQPLTEFDRVIVCVDQAAAHSAEVLAAADPLHGLYPTRVELEPGAKVNWGGRTYEVVNVTAETAFLVGKDNRWTRLPLPLFRTLVDEGQLTQEADPIAAAADAEADERWMTASEEARAEAVRREKLLALLKEGVRSANGLVSRTADRWNAAYMDAKARFNGRGIIGLLPKERSGNRNRRIEEEVAADLDAAIEELYKTKGRRPKMRTAYRTYRARQRRLKRHAVAYETFRLHVGWHSLEDLVREREGAKAAYAHERRFWRLEWQTPMHGQFPLQFVHLDHTELDIDLVDSEGVELGRPWLTLALDAFSRRVLAFHLSFDPPSYISLMMVMREIVWQYGRLPVNVIVDGGKEFASTAFEILLGLGPCHKVTRPIAQSRFGAELESAFNVTTVQLIRNLAGGTEALKYVRRIVPEVDPANLATWTLKALTILLSKYFYGVWDERPHPSLGMSPGRRFDLGQWRSPRRHVYIPYNEAFLVNTMPRTTKGAAKCVPGRGVKVNGEYYWHELFGNGRHEGKDFAVRWDPFDLGHVYAYVDGRWHEALSKNLHRQGMSHRDLKISSIERRQRMRVAGQLSRDDDSLGDLLEEVFAIERELTGERDRRRRQNVENRKAFKATRTGAASDVEEPEDRALGEDEYLWDDTGLGASEVVA
jgi:putative transposase